MLAQQRLASELEVLSLSASGGAAAATASGARTGDDAEGGQEAPLDSLLASAAEIGGLGKSNAHQASGSSSMFFVLFFFQHQYCLNSVL